MDSLIIFGAKYLFIAVPLLYLLAWLQANRRYKALLALAFIIAGIAAVILDKISAKLYYDPRPFVAHHLKPLVAHAADNGFPSDHTLFTITIATALIFYRPKLGTLAFIIGLLVGISRVAAHVHSPIDIIGAALMGIAAGWLGYYLASKVLHAVAGTAKQVPHQANKRQD